MMMVTISVMFMILNNPTSMMNYDRGHQKTTGTRTFIYFK